MTSISQSNIDENLYSRVLYAIGHDTMSKIIESSVLICGLNGLGNEIAKNVILSGFKRVVLQDTVTTTLKDLSSNCFLTEDDVGKCRADACLTKLAELNPNVKVELCKEVVDDNMLLELGVTVVVLADSLLDEQLRVNKICRELNIKFIATTSFGLFGYIFCDYGNNFTVVNTNGEAPMTGMVDSITVSNGKTYVKCIDSKRHGLTTGDTVKFVKGVPDPTDVHTVEYIDGFTFSINSEVKDISFYEQVKQSLVISFKSLDNALKDASLNNNQLLHECYKLYNEQTITDGRKPTVNDVDSFCDMLTTSTTSITTSTTVSDKQTVLKFLHCLNGVLCPTVSVIGGIVAQEIIKACSFKFTPINQFFYFEAFDCLPENITDLEVVEKVEKVSDRYIGQRSIFGDSVQDLMSKQNYFVVGAGAIGCELLKNFAAIGLGNIYVTDMDSIEKSNLSRQFLFREKDIGKPKSETAALAVKQMNPFINIVPYLTKVGPETEDTYSSEFMKNLDCVTNALDNVEARLYIDSRCVTYGLPLIESGTLGTKGNVQVVVPHLTESYGSSQDPPEESVPVCTIKNFPNSIEHTVQWALDIFEELFNIIPKAVIKQLSDNVDNTQNIDKDVKQVVTHMKNDCLTYDDCIKIIYNKWETYYKHDINALLERYPENHVTADGSQFWSKTKKCPKPISFSVNNPAHTDFVKFGAKILFNIYKDHKDGVITPQQFEKDNDSNYHVDFITAASNMRALNYNVEVATRYKTKGIAGKIVPALVTTTSVIAGLATLEVYKTVQKFKDVEKYKNSFINLALPFFAFTEPVKAPVTVYKGVSYTMWDTFDVQGGTTLQQILDLFEEKDMEVEFLSYNSFIIYSAVLPLNKQQERLSMTVEQIIETFLGETVKDVISLTVGVEPDDISDEEDVDLPQIRYFTKY